MGWYGGLNGDGFFNEEYEDGGYEWGEDASGYRSPKHINTYGNITKHGETEKAIRFQETLPSGETFTFWMPKSFLSKPHFEHVPEYAVNMFINNRLRAIQDVQSNTAERMK